MPTVNWRLKGTPSPAELAILKPYLARLSPIQRQGVLKDWKYPVSDASGFNRNNLLTARQLLIKAGYTFKNGRLLDTQGKPIRIEFLIHQDGLQRDLDAVYSQHETSGRRSGDPPVSMCRSILSACAPGIFDMTTNVMPQSLNPGNEQAQFWGSASADQPGTTTMPALKIL